MVVAIPQILIVGLGNLPFPMTRHSVGHLIIDSLASRLGVSLVSDRALGGLIGQTTATVGDTGALVNVTLFKTKPLMNASGRAVANALRQTVKSTSSMIIIHDSLGHKPAKISYKFGGSANGHNGLKSIISALGGDTNFHRLRIGIGHNDVDAAQYVLKHLSQREQEFWGTDGDGVELVLKEVQRIVSPSGHII